MECFAQFINIPVVDPDLQIRGARWGGGGGVVSKTLRKGGGGSLQKKFFLAFGPQFGLKLRGERGVGPSPGSATAYATCISPIIHFISPPQKKKKKNLHNLFFIYPGYYSNPK